MVLFFADLLIHHLQHTGTIAGFGLIAMDDKIFVYLGTVIMEDVLCSVYDTSHFLSPLGNTL